MLSMEAMRLRVDLGDSRELYRFETLVNDAAKHLSPAAVQVAIEQHRLHCPFMPAISDLMKHSAEWRAERAADARRRAVERDAKAQLALPAPNWTAEDEARWAGMFARLMRNLEAAPGPPQRHPGHARDWSKPPEHSDLSPALKTLAEARGWARQDA